MTLDPEATSFPFLLSSFHRVSLILSLDSPVVPRHLAVAPDYIFLINVHQGRGSILVRGQRCTLSEPAWS